MTDSGRAEAVQTIPLLEERLAVGRRVVETGRVRVRLSTAIEDALVRETVRGERVEIERVPVGREVAAGAPAVREEEDGAVLVVPVLEEILVVERRLVLKEELRIRRVATAETIEQTVALRRQAATVERLPAVPQDGPDPDTRRHDGNGD